jgi:hypothetical protein
MNDLFSDVRANVSYEIHMKQIVIGWIYKSGRGEVISGPDLAVLNGKPGRRNACVGFKDLVEG